MAPNQFNTEIHQQPHQTLIALNARLKEKVKSEKTCVCTFSNTNTQIQMQNTKIQNTG